ncbi:PhzF family phenazine biosynthesis protein [Candidatus Enterococcus mangumiae]|uniref:Phenazine biosynthesis protein PhzF n=1 Tax=Candidatus Enterococcus mangumiae TaxID=2230878 RepID=A0ABZ2SU54_9ENTE|nr:PhzF family phenazine biosynthesis protein [Enterococcus sp. DIV1094]MBO0488738.1 PhzF family phenazine biosynthesis protein [Enterococcus sp. DIV1094]
MNLSYYVVDAFTNEVFKGNPAAVYVLDKWLSDETMQKIAIENNLSETAFTVKKGKSYELRWFTPDREIDLCGHATLATAFVLFNFYGITEDTISFSTQSGELFVTKKEERYAMDFPSILPQPIAILPEYEQAIGVKILEAYLARDLFFVLEDEETVANLTPDYTAMTQLQAGVGVIVTAEGKNEDFVSRTFFPKLTINEDPVCGSAHANLIPYWAKKLGKDQFIAQQLSPRGGYLTCQWLGDRVMISGEATLFARGEAYI